MAKDAAGDRQMWFIGFFFVGFSLKLSIRRLRVGGNDWGQSFYTWVTLARRRERLGTIVLPWMTLARRRELLRTLAVPTFPGVLG